MVKRPSSRQASPDGFDFAASGRRVIEVETRGLAAMAGRIDGAFTEACRALLACEGRIACSGMGKSGHIARKIAATLASTGTPAFYVHPGEAGHGDLRRTLDDDAVDLRTTRIADVMTRKPTSIGSDALAVEAAQLMEQHKINALLVVDQGRQVVGALNIHDLLRARVV